MKAYTTNFSREIQILSRAGMYVASNSWFCSDIAVVSLISERDTSPPQKLKLTFYLSFSLVGSRSSNSRNSRISRKSSSSSDAIRNFFLL